MWQSDWSGLTSLILKHRWKNAVAEMAEQARMHPDAFVTDGGAELYQRRWTQNRTIPVPQSVAGPVEANRGPWRGLFANNPSRTTMYNTWSGDDRILTVVWRSNNYDNKPYALKKRVLLEKPLRALFDSNARLRDNKWIMAWGNAEWTADEWDYVFDEYGAEGEYWNIKRQWGEVSFWFPATAGAAGAMDLDEHLEPCQDCVTDFTKYSAYVGPEEVEASGSLRDTGAALGHSHTHSYLSFGPFGKVFPAFDEIRKMFDTND
jgi:hypothetical protein